MAHLGLLGHLQGVALKKVGKSDLSAGANASFYLQTERRSPVSLGGLSLTTSWFKPLLAKQGGFTPKPQATPMQSTGDGGNLSIHIYI